MVDLAQQTQTTIETTTNDQQKGEKYSIYCAPYLGNRVFAGPFAAGTERKAHTAGDNAPVHNEQTNDTKTRPPYTGVGKGEEYAQISRGKHGYNTKQDLGMLHRHEHDPGKATQDLANFTHFPDEWGVENTGTGKKVGRGETESDTKDDEKTNRNEDEYSSNAPSALLN